ncbi:hypothetical protein FRC12_007612 [Ceratobasidium sp. 428]|nr:hypothetical protein FRC12_007612 [Ceratobasidium sp. 428]
MGRHFLHDPLSGRLHTMATSIFSHSALLHLAFNSLALMSFGTAMNSVLKKQQASAPSGMPESTSTYHFLSFFLSAGLFSSYVSHIVSTRIRLPILLRALLTSPAKADITPAAAASMTIAPSLGASGAIYAAVTASALAFPDANVSLIFLPFVSLPIGAGVGGMVCLDIIGIIRGWRTFDHWAHLGGAIFGVAYYNYGANFWDWVRRHTPGSHPIPFERVPPSPYVR